MGSKGSSAPPPPDPRQTAQAQTGTNIGTAIANTMMGNVGQQTPYGSLSYGQTGTYNYTDPYTDQAYDIPQFTATQTLSPEQQRLYGTNVGTQQNLASIGQEQSAFLQNYLGEPVDLSSGNVESYIDTHFQDDFNEQWGQREQAMASQLANQGIGIGSDAYTRAMGDFSTERSNAYDNLYGNQYGRAQQSILTERNQPINEIMALLSGSQVQQPNFVPTSTSNIPTTDVAGIIGQNYATQSQNAQAAADADSGLWGSILGAAGTIAPMMMMMSDKRLKKDIKPVGKLYEYHYKDDPKGTPKRVGVMAGEIEKIRPDAVVTRDDGMKGVKYGELFGLAA